MKLTDYDLIIWDFNGTILDDTAACLSIMNGFLSDYGLQPLSLQEYREGFSFPVEEYYEKLGLTAFESFNVLADRFVELYHNKIIDMKVFEDVEELVKKLKQEGIKQIILSASKQDILEEQLQKVELTGYFTAILGINDIYAKSKVEIGEIWLKENAGTFMRKLLIGDSEHDYETAKLLKTDCLLCCRGHISKDRLRATGEVVVDDFKELLFNE